MNTNRKVKPFGIMDKFGYMFGDFGNDFTFILSTMVLLKFYTDIMAVPAYIVGIVMMVARIVDAFTDVAMGRICDRSKVRASGKFKPWLLRMCGFVALSSFLMYQSSLADMDLTFKVIYLFITYILWGSVFYTSINIPYGSMASAISADPGDRQSLSTFRSMGATLAGLVIGVGLPMFAYKKIDGKETLIGENVTIIAAVFSVFAIVCYLLCYFMTTERVQPEVDVNVQKKNSVGKMLLNALKNRALISIIAASIVMLLAQLTMQAIGGYIYPDYYNNANAQSISSIIMVVGMMVAAAIAKPLAKKFGKAELSIASNLFAALICVITFFVRPENVWVYVALQALNWLGLGIFTMVSWALITDVIDYSELKNGIREDGSVYALYSFARKLGQAASSGLTGALLTMIGYNEVTRTDPAVLDGIFNISVIVPAIGFIGLALVLWFWYPLHKKQVDANVAALKAKHEAEKNAKATEVTEATENTEA